MENIGLVLEGGGMRGVYTAGVLDFFEDAHLRFQNVIGVSAGACNAVSYLSRQRGRNIKINSTYCTDKRYISLGNWIRQGSIFGMDFLFDEIPNRILPFDYAAYEQSGAHLTCVATDCLTGKPHYFDCTNAKDAYLYIRASSSIPMFAKMVEIDGRPYLDGSTADSIPVQHSIDEGNTRHVIVLTQHDGYQKSPQKFAALCRIKYRKYPNLVHAMLHRHENYNASLALVRRLKEEGKAVVIQPQKPVTISRFEKDTEKILRLYQDGYDDARRQLSNLQSLLQND